MSSEIEKGSLKRPEGHIAVVKVLPPPVLWGVQLIALIEIVIFAHVPSVGVNVLHPSIQCLVQARTFIY